MPVAVQSEKVRELVDENAEVEQIATGFTFTEGPDLDGRRVAPLQRHAGRQAAALASGRRRHGAARPEQQVQRDDARQRRQPDRLRARHELGRPEAPDGTPRDARHALERQGAEQPERRDRRLATARSSSPTRPTGGCPASASSASRSSTSRASTALAGGRRRPAAAGRRLRAAERPLLLAGRVAALHQRHRPRAHPRLRRRRRTTSSRTDACSRRASATATSASGELVDGMKLDERGNVYVTGPDGVWIFAPDGEHLGVIEVPEKVGKRQLGRRRLAARCSSRPRRPSTACG